MNDPTVQVILAVFDDENSTEAALKQLKAAKKGEPRVQAAVAMFKDANGSRFRYKEVGLTPGKGALGGVILGATLGILTGGATIILGAAGALLGSLAGRKKQESRLPTDRINQVVASLQRGLRPSGSCPIRRGRREKIWPTWAPIYDCADFADIAEQLMNTKAATLRCGNLTRNRIKGD
jgi:hypothetical protein